MPSISDNDKYSKVYLEAKLLSEKISLLREKSKGLLFIELFSLTILPIYVLALYLFIYVYESREKTLIVSVLGVILIVYLIFYFIRKTSYRKTITLNLEVRQKCNELSDSVDWITMRKKQLYNTLDERIQKPIDDFLSYSNSKLCPISGGRKLQLFIQILLLLEMLACPLVSVGMLL